MNVSVIIVNYNTTKLTIDVINSVFEKTNGIKFEIIVVDNNSQDQSIELINELFPTIKFIKNDQNLGFGRANNIGAKYADGDYLFFLNSDTILVNNAIKILFEFIDKNPKVGICGGNLFDVNNIPIHSYMKYFRSPFIEICEKTYFSHIFKYYSIQNQFNFSNKPIEVAFITGADLLIRTNLFKKLKGFDPDFFMYFEDAELGFRVIQLGYKIMSVPDAFIKHLVGKSSILGEKKLGIFLGSKYLYYRKVNNVFYEKLARIFDFFSALVGIIYYLIFYNHVKYRTCLYYLKLCFRNNNFISLNKN